jgi:hypothetical protein
MAQLVVWKTPAEAKKKLASRLKAAKEYRKRTVEDQWLANEKYAYGSNEDADLRNQLAQMASDTEDFDVGESIEVSYAFRALRFIHAQWSSNPPVSTARPQSSDLEDRRAARAADHVMKWSLRRFQLQEKYDLAGLDCLVYGTGITYTGWNGSLGDILEFDAESGRLLMEGDIEVRVVTPWDFYLDPSARAWADVRYVFERITLSEEEARSKFPNKWSLFRKYKKKSERHTIAAPAEGGIEIQPEESVDELFDIYAYWEPGLPENGFLGRHCLCFEDGTLITSPAENPNIVHPSPSLDERRAFREGRGELSERRPGKARLPFHIVTDIDVPGQVWGRSALEYAGPAQNLLKNLDSATLEAAKVHGVVRMILPPGAKLAASPSNSNVDVIEMETEGSGEVKYMQPPGLPAVMTELRANMRVGIDDMFGLNEANFGQASRETSGFQMQYAVNQSNLIRRRLFNKSVAFVESMYKGILALGVLHWDAEKALRVLGNEDAFDVMALKGIDIDGGFEIETEYGTSLPLDPTARREELLKYMPLYEKAGVPPRRLLANLRLAELETTQSLPELARNRMQEILDVMISEGRYIAPRKFQDHEGMLAYLLEYVMLAPYQSLPDTAKVLVEKHIEERRQLAASEAAPAPAAPGAPGLPTAPTTTPAPGTELAMPPM